MSKFRVGDVVVGDGFTYAVWCNGAEGTVVGHERKGRFLDGRDSLAVDVRWADGRVNGADVKCLRLKRPPSWDKWLYDTREVEREKDLVQV